MFVPGLMELEMYGRIRDQGMWPYRSRVRRDCDVYMWALLLLDTTRRQVRHYFLIIQLYYRCSVVCRFFFSCSGSGGKPDYDG